METKVENPQTILNYRPSFHRSAWMMLHLVALLFFLILFSCYPIEKRIEYVGYYLEGSVHVVVEEEFFAIQEKELLLEEKKYTYQVQNIQPITYENGKAKYWEVTMKLDLPKAWKIDNYQFRLSFLRERKTILQKILQKIKKGMRL